MLNSFLEPTIEYKNVDPQYIPAKPMCIKKWQNVQEGGKLFSDKRDTIYKLPDFLKGSFVFQLPYKKVPKGTVFTIQTHFPSSEIYLVHRAHSGWNESNITDNLEATTRWERKPGEIVMKPFDKYHAPFLPYIWCHRIEKGVPMNLPEITHDETFAAIFLVQGKNLELVLTIKISPYYYDV